MTLTTAKIAVQVGLFYADRWTAPPGIRGGFSPAAGAAAVVSQVGRISDETLAYTVWRYRSASPRPYLLKSRYPLGGRRANLEHNPVIMTVVMVRIADDQEILF